ncbi:SRPBCC family protein [Pedobacter glucosidilyticus]|uniref:SRPBCC family protein n=1 Tax=Pedobacter glucosidilyticus TaxID=1122941 RepID=UPI000417FE10|nr:SRPBCC family protein [Pedobacter glucosidilyticus]
MKTEHAIHSGKHQRKHKKEFINVNNAERLISLAAGGMLLAKHYKHPLANPIKVLTGAFLVYRGLSGNCPLYTGLDKNSNETNAINTRVIFTVNKPREEVYRYWRQLENLPFFMSHLQRVEQKNDVESEWIARIPGGVGIIKWNAEIVKEIPNELIGWQSIENSTINNAGKVEFYDAPRGQGTVLKVIFSYHPPAGALGEGVAKLFNPLFKTILKEDIRAFKQVIEAGEVATIKGQPSGRK